MKQVTIRQLDNGGFVVVHTNFGTVWEQYHATLAEVEGLVRAVFAGGPHPRVLTAPPAAPSASRPRCGACGFAGPGTHRCPGAKKRRPAVVPRMR